MKTIDLNFGILTIYDNNVTAIEIKDGYNIEKKDVMAVIQAAESNTVGAYALISNRKAQYSTDVINLYKVLSARDNLKCAAIVAYRETTVTVYDQEKTIKEVVSKGSLPMELFYNLDDAIEWANKSLLKQ